MNPLEVAYSLLLYQCFKLLFTIHSEKILRGHEIFYKIDWGREILVAVCVGLQKFLVKFQNPFRPGLFHTL